MIKKSRVFLVLAPLLLLAGCVQQTVIDQITIPIVAGLDKGPGSKMRLTISSPLFKGKDSITNMESTSVSHTVENAREILQEDQQLPYMFGKVSVRLFGRELAEQGIAIALDSTLRDTRMSNRMYLAVVDGKAQQLLEADFTKTMEKGHYIHQQITSNIMGGHLPRTNLHMFGFAWLGKGRDPYLPLVKIEDEKIKITGLALFADDKFVDSLNAEEMKIFRLLVEKTNNGSFEVRLNKDDYVSVQNSHSQFRYTMATRFGLPEFKIRVKMKGMIKESTTFQITDSLKRKVEEVFNKAIAKDGEELIRRFQKQGIDPLGLGDFARSRTRHWDEKIWKEQYPDVKVTIEAKVKITEVGAVN